MARNILVSANFNPKSFASAKILEAFRKIDKKVLDVQVSIKLNDQEKFHETMYRREFCLHVRGDTTSSQRLFLIINANCIPIIISDNIFLPFESLIDYDLFSFKVDEAFVINDVHGFVGFLREISTEKKIEMREKLTIAKELFSFYSANKFNAVSLLFIDLLISKIKLCAHVVNGVNSSRMSIILCQIE